MLTLVPITLKAARRYVQLHHRHNRAPQGGLFAVACRDEAGTLRGVAVVGRPISQANQDGFTCEVLRVCTDGAHNACSLFYGAAARAAKALGYRRIITYTLASEPGTSLRAAGWERDGEVPAGKWDRPSRPRVDVDLFGDSTKPSENKVRWCRRLAADCPDPAPGAG